MKLIKGNDIVYSLAKNKKIVKTKIPSVRRKHSKANIAMK